MLVHGLYTWFKEHGSELIHPDDLSRFAELQHSNLVFEKIGYEEPYIVIQYGEHTFRVLPKLWKPAPTVKYRIGDSVSFQGMRCTVSGIMWHYKREEPFYFLLKDGRKSTRRHFSEELEALP